MYRYLLLSLLCLSILSSCGDVKFSSSPATSNPPAAGSGGTVGTTQLRDVNYSTTTSSPNNKLDILLVVDDSNSMLADNQKLAQKLSGFVSSLQSSSIDWQMCVTVTRYLTLGATQTWGSSIVWSDYTPAAGVKNWVLKPTANLSTVFTNTINTIGAGWANSDDERGIKAAWWHMSNNASNTCYRTDAALSMIVISDEDERSVGGNKALEFNLGEYKALENDDYPAALALQVKNLFGSTKKFTANSIIVKPGDTACMKEQDTQGSKSHAGELYAGLSKLTGGGISSICEADFSTNLNLFKGIITDSIASYPLECAPVGDVTVSVSPTFTYTYAIQGQSIVFTPSLPLGRQLNLKYKCNN